MNTSEVTAETPTTEPKPVRKTKWYWSVLGFVTTLWTLGGLNVLLLRDIPLLLFLGLGIGAMMLPIARLLGRPERHRINAVWGFGVILTMLASVLFVIPPFFISRQTTCLTTPRSKEFYGIDYATVIEQKLDPGVPPAENGFRLLTETFGRPFFGDKFSDRHWNRLCRYLDLPTEFETKSTYLDWRTFLTDLTPEEKEIIKKSGGGESVQLWPEEAAPIVRRWLDENEAALDLFVTASHMPILYLPPMFEGILISTILTNDHICREMSRSLQIRVRYRLAMKDVDNAWNDVSAMYRLAEQHRRGVWCVISSLVNNSIVNTANRSAEAVLLHSDWTPDEIRRKAEESAVFQQPFSDAELKAVLLNERLIALDSIQNIANGNYDFNALSDEEQPRTESFFKRFERKATMRFCRMGSVMSGMNRRFDEMERQLANDLPMSNDEETILGLYGILKVFVWHGQIGSPPFLIGRIMESMLADSIEPWRMSLKTRRANTALTRFLFDLEAYRREHDGNYPDQLAELTERDEIPLDPFSNNPFRYVKESTEDGKAGSLLYSVGPNGVDKDGRNGNDTPRGDDIRRRINALR